MSQPRFSGRTALITGAGSGIGRALALAFAAEGAYVVASGRTRTALEETVTLVERAGGVAIAQPADVTDPDSIDALIGAAVERFGSLDVAVNNAGIARAGQPLADTGLADWHALMDTNLTGLFLALRAEVRQMRAQPHGGAIVNIASNLGVHTQKPGMTAYSASKAAVASLTRGAALEHIRDGVRINSVSPGVTRTSMSLLPGETEEGRAARMKEQSPLGRAVTTDEVARAVLYLASQDAAPLVGTDLVIDGGTTL
ncbi:SDR family NAD(P)-dependent oxidoreductase [Streptomyces acidiscabies]|uniref:SDR family oxidoreductase n=1 Tax=Streptomyces acidiscabies TaxID=42234 RepID=A0AAP6BAS1_9ACTN|nr:SDR family oxidoreductase [Streptomyces acidiscabies]MBZ3917015.1 SDR family oxidoreductase [Streptomyces acidiscabies]MDX2961254.1 SDR family oxidoreductase [Streptomyces acidiscabies]MDX3022612.1 SDR family oxidoreductase [Streptomyces acidiscabies]MDX3791976.1 SDR family oxidoreductase [Streptomyces acidiscabies]GAQ56421.1 glucose 1-dehydrogenase 2 [Streptomyces acidiscabies]